MTGIRHAIAPEWISEETLADWTVKELAERADPGGDHFGSGTPLLTETQLAELAPDLETAMRQAVTEFRLGRKLEEALITAMERLAARSADLLPPEQARAAGKRAAQKESDL